MIEFYPVGNPILLVHIWILPKILGIIAPNLECFKKVYLKSKYPNRDGGERSNFKFLVWQKSYQAALLGPIWCPICNLTNFGPFQYVPDGTGGWDFTCQHGPNECIGNLYQACLLDKLVLNSDKVEAINCIMSDDQPDQATKKVW